MDNFGFLKVAAAIPALRVGDCTYNMERTAALAEEAARRGVEIAVFPELGMTAYTCGDLVLQPTLLDAADEALARLAKATRKLPLALIVGAPLRHGSALYNCAVVMAQGKVLGVVPKSYIPNYGEFYEDRWFASGAGISEERIDVAGQQADFGADLTFAVNGAEFGVEICEDLWAPIPPSTQLALNGAKVIFNLSASPELAGKHAYLRQLVTQQSARTLSAYVYVSAGSGESSTDLTFAGNGLIAENGTLLREAERFSTEEQLVVADVDLQRLAFERLRNTSFRQRESSSENTVIEMEIPEGLRAARTVRNALVSDREDTRTLSARYHKDGSEILVSRGEGENPRKLTPRECARLQGFPDEFIIPVSDTQAYHQFGNSVTVPVIRSVARLMMGAMRDGLRGA